MNFLLGLNFAHPSSVIQNIRKDFFFPKIEEHQKKVPRVKHMLVYTNPDLHRKLGKLRFFHRAVKNCRFAISIKI